MTDFTRTSPTSGGELPAAFTEVGGVILDIIGTNGARLTTQLSARDLFFGFFNDGSPIEFRGDPGTIGIQPGYTTNLVDALGGGIAELAVRITVLDGDTAAGDFDFNLNTLLLNGIELGNFSEVETQETTSDGQTNLGTQFGFANDALNTGWFYSDDSDFLQAFFDTLSTGEVIFELDDVDPFDNFFDFTQGIDGGAILPPVPPNIIPNARDDEFTTTEGVAITGDVFADNGFGADSDADGDPFSVVEVNDEESLVGSTITLESGSTVSIGADGLLEYTPDAGFTGTDTFSYTISDGALTDTAFVTVNVSGIGPGNQNLVGTPQPDVLTGMAGDDTIVGRGDDDVLTGGAGNDFILGNRDNDTLFGGAGDDDLRGGREDDTIDGGAGADTLSGDFGTDLLTGGDDLDTFTFMTRTADSIDTITDATAGETFVLSGFDAGSASFQADGSNVLLLAENGGVETELAVLQNVAVGDFGDFTFVY